MAKAMEFKRGDIIILLRQIKGVTNIKHIVEKINGVLRDYYIENNQILQGKSETKSLIDIEETVVEFLNSRPLYVKRKYRGGEYEESKYDKRGVIEYKRWDKNGKLIKN